MSSFLVAQEALSTPRSKRHDVPVAAPFFILDGGRLDFGAEFTTHRSRNPLVTHNELLTN